MSSNIVDIVTIAQVVQAAVAPVFLLTGVAALLGILSTRLGRVTDRARTVEDRLAPQDPNSDEGRRGGKELRLLWRRASLINRAFILCTICALLVCGVVVVIFLSHAMSLAMSSLISTLFIVAMLFLIVGLLLLLSEVFIATRSMRDGIESWDVNITRE